MPLWWYFKWECWRNSRIYHWLPVWILPVLLEQSCFRQLVYSYSQDSLLVPWKIGGRQVATGWMDGCYVFLPLLIACIELRKHRWEQFYFFYLNPFFYMCCHYELYSTKIDRKWAKGTWSYMHGTRSGKARCSLYASFFDVWLAVPSFNLNKILSTWRSCKISDCFFFTCSSNRYHPPFPNSIPKTNKMHSPRNMNNLYW